jgi:hypothetical protein
MLPFMPQAPPRGQGAAMLPFCMNRAAANPRLPDGAALPDSYVLTDSDSSSIHITLAPYLSLALCASPTTANPPWSLNRVYGETQCTWQITQKNHNFPVEANDERAEVQQSWN